MKTEWHYQPSAGNHDYLVYDLATGRDVAIVRDFNEANARLIAAAPALVETSRALVLVLTELTSLGVFDDLRGMHPDQLNRALDAWDAALAKAEGRDL